MSIYYGWPSLVNGAGGDVVAAADSFARFGIVVLGDGLQDPGHGDHSNTALIIDDLVLRGVEVYGYIDMGVSTQNLSAATAKARVDAWNAMGVTGIFWDDAGYDYGVDRARQADLIGYTHSAGLVAFVNAWDPDDVLATDQGSPTALSAGDLYLAESHPVASGTHVNLAAWWSKSVALDGYRSSIGIRVAAVSTGPQTSSGWANRSAYRQPLWAAILWGWDAFGYTNDQYSASGGEANAAVPLPNVFTDSGSTYAGAPTQVSGDTFVRDTDIGQIRVTGDVGWGYGAFHGGACDTTLLGEAIWPHCDNVPPEMGSPFGPRQLASGGLRHDWHRGIDAPQALGAPVYATMDGIVRISGVHSGYSDPLVQLRHRGASPYLYSNSMHLDTWYVAEGDLVTVGDLVGLSGASDSGYEHLHFEFRDGCVNQPCNVNPWGLLPYADTAPAAPSLGGALLSSGGSHLLFDLTAVDTEMDLDGFTVDWAGAQTLSFDAQNATSDPDFPAGMDHPVRDLGGGVRAHIYPERFNATFDQADYRIALTGLPPAQSGTVAGRDVNGDGAPSAVSPDLPTVTVTLPTQVATVGAGAMASFRHVIQNTGVGTVNLTLTARSAQNNLASVSPATMSLAPGAAATATVSVTLQSGAGFPVPNGDSVLLEIAGGAAHAAIAVDEVLAADPAPPACAPAIAFTAVPAYGSFDNLQGSTSCVAANDYGVAVVIMTGGWWSKPTFGAPVTPLAPDGTWVADITTGGSDEFATEITAFLVPLGYDVPLASGDNAIPAEYGDTAVATTTATRGPVVRTVQFGGHTWDIKSSNGGVVGPGPNVFSDDPADVWVDGNGALHLTISNRDGTWRSTEIVSQESLGYGTYTFVVESRVDLLDSNVVLGMFTWDTDAPEFNYREIDVEIARWGDPLADNTQFVVQPWDTPGNRYRFESTLDVGGSLHSFEWKSDQVHFESHAAMTVPPTGSDVIDLWTYTGADVPPAGGENARINLWLMGGLAPQNGAPVEVVLRDFVFTPPSSGPIEVFASGEVTTQGTVTGGWGDTLAADGSAEQLTEVESGGKPSKRTSLLDHDWALTVPEAAGGSLSVRAWSGGSSDGDTFAFAWSVDQSSWTTFGTVSSTSAVTIATSLPALAAGTVYVRVTDTDRTRGNRALDSVFVDQIVIELAAPPSMPPAAPTGLTAVAQGATSIDLAWTDNATTESSFDIERSPDGVAWSSLASVASNITTHADTGLPELTTYHYRVRAMNSAGPSAWSTVASDTTSAAPVDPILLGTAGYKRKGIQHVDVTWSGAVGPVDVFRDDVAIATDQLGAGSITDNLGVKGSGTYTYQVCESAGAPCSQPSVVVF